MLHAYSQLGSKKFTFYGSILRHALTAKEIRWMGMLTENFLHEEMVS